MVIGIWLLVYGAEEMGNKIKNFKDLLIWQEGIEIVKDIYRLSSSFPKAELYGLSSQIRKCAVSIPSNIAEGFKRFYYKDYRRFLYIALGSAAELETQLVISEKLKYISNEEVQVIYVKLERLAKMITNLMKKLKQHHIPYTKLPYTNN
jgi:four helix bundle protein